jgi:type I restriction enzyme, R subunit
MPTPEQLARQTIDALLQPCGWIVQSRREMNLGAGRGIAVREFPFAQKLWKIQNCRPL